MKKTTTILLMFLLMPCVALFAQDEEGPAEPEDLVDVTLPLTFEDQEFNWEYAFLNFDGGEVQVIENPEPDETNDSEWVGQMVKGGGQFWGGSFMHIDEAFTFDADNHTITMKVWSPRFGVPVLMKVEQQDTDAEFEIAQETNTSEEWEEMTWDMSGAGFDTEWDVITLIFDLEEGQEGDGEFNFTWYFDDLEVQAAGATQTNVDLGKDTPSAYNLRQNYPNPFNPTTNIQFELPENAEVKLNVYNLMGQHVATLASGTYQAGLHSVDFDATNMASGIYLYQLQTGSFTQTNKMLLVK